MQEAFEVMIRHNQGRIRYIASRYSRGGEFDDMYQEILMQLWRSFSSFNGESAQETWVYKVALNTAFSFARQSIKHKQAVTAMPINLEQNIEPAQHQCQSEILDKFMDSLNDTDASILMMYLDGLCSDSIAEVIGITSNAVRSRVKRIKQLFEQNYIGE